MFATMRLFVLSALAVSAFAQPPGGIRGSVVDSQGGEPLSSVAIRLAGTAFRATSDASGHFRLPNLPPGDYTLDVSTVG